jgi:hypothetical protein
MKILALLCLAALAACTSSNRGSLGPVERASAPSGCCDVTVQCRPDGSCVLVGTRPNGTPCEIVLDCDAPCDPARCASDPCDVDVDCLPNGSCRITCTADDGSTCETTVDCCGTGTSKACGRAP